MPSSETSATSAFKIFNAEVAEVQAGYSARDARPTTTGGP